MKLLAVIAVLVAVAASQTIVTTTWTIPELSAAIQDPHTDPELVPILEEALNELMYYAVQGHPVEAINIPLPAALVPAPAPAPVVPDVPIVSPVVPDVPIVSPVVPEVPIKPPVVIPAEVPSSPAEVSSASSPLVQIIVNVNQQGEQAPSPSPVVVPGQTPDTVHVVEQSPEAVHVVEQPYNPIDFHPLPVVVPGAPVLGPIV